MPDLYREPIDSSAEASSLPPGSPVNSVESEIAELEKQIAQKRALLGAEKEQKPEQALAAEKAVVAPVQTGPASSAAAAPAPASAVKPEMDKFKGLEKNQQLKNLVDLAFQKGITYAADVARELDSAYLMDEFHDTLVDQLHKELVEKGKLEEI